MTVSEDGRYEAGNPPVGRPPRYTPEKRAALGDEAWDLRDRQGKGSRTIARMFTERGDPCSHTLICELIAEAIDRAKFLDFVGPAHSRAASIGRLELALERQLETIEQHKVALSTGELQGGKKVDYEQAAGVLDKAVARYLQLETLWVKVTGAAMPTRHQIEDANGEPVGPNLAVLAGVQRAVTEHAQKTRVMEETDGLGG